MATTSGDVGSILQTWDAAFDEQIAQLDAVQIDIRRHLHAHPEPSGEEVETSKFIAARLQQAGVEARVSKKGVGVIADVTLGTPAADAPLIAIRSDIDALRLHDEKSVAYKSQTPGVCHACGHDAHTSIVMGAALAAAQLQKQFAQQQPGCSEQPGCLSAGFGLRLRLLFQSSEETSEGAVWLVEDGGLHGVGAILGLHVDPERPAGTVGIRYGILTANCDDIEIRVSGRGGHAARPHHTIDPVAAAAQLISALYQSLPRSVDSRSPAVLTIGQIHGGNSPNVIPQHVDLAGTLRTIGEESRKTLKRRFAEIVRGVEQLSGATIDLRLFAPLKAVDNHPQVAAALEEASRRVLGAENVFLIDLPSMGGEDFSVYLDHVPGAMLRLGCGVPGTHPPFLHSPVFDLDERTIGIGTRILVRAALLLSAGLRSRREATTEIT